MRVHLLYFAALGEVFGQAEERVELPPQVTTIGALADWLAARHPAFAARRAHVRIARNEAFAGEADSIAEGDTIALIPPVAGG
jgi:molybdopterin synthase sulfur carrier subunit